MEKVVFCPTTENLLASTGHDGGVRLWDVRLPGGAAGAGKGTQMADCKIGDPGLFLTWHPQGQEVLVGTKGDSVYSVDLRRLDAADKTIPPENRTPAVDPSSPPRYYAMAFSNSGREVFATTGDGPVKILDYPSMSPLHTLGGHSSATYSVQHSPRGEWLAMGGGDSIITLWDTTDWYCAHTLTAHTSSVRDLSFSFDGAYIVAGSGVDARDGTSGLEIYHTGTFITVLLNWNDRLTIGCAIDTGDVAHTLDTNNPVTVAAWHPYKYWIAYAGDPGGLKLFGPSPT